ncbi:hypothetical protein M3A82_004710 [Micrococcus luteus]|uniref:Type III restriction endonuclease subunit M n=1 Tax=Micrococcus luteus TaxID=1270 RepID=A0AAP3ESQ0_MICLU|nr:hypothetical protein [Micrococcus luteus]
MIQIKTRERVRSLAEVYTHTREVTAMLDLVSPMFPTASNPKDTDRKFFEPAAGSGNFLEAILRRKLAFITTDMYRSQLHYEQRVLRALASIYAVDIDPENVDESKDRLRHVLQSHLDNDMNTRVPTEGFARAVGAILETNLVLADTLRDLSTIEWVDYQARPNGRFRRVWSTAGADDALRDLFWREKVDEVPVHYSELDQYPGPVTAREKDSA